MTLFRIFLGAVILALLLARSVSGAALLPGGIS